MDQGDYARQLLLQLNQQRSKGYLCDVIVVVENALFQAHKNILAASSNYFKSLVLHDNLVSLDTEMVSPSVFRKVLDFIYTGHLTSDPAGDQGVSALLTAASYLQLSDLSAVCHKRLKSSSSSRTPNGHVSLPQRLSCDPPRVTRRSHKWEGRRKDDVSEEELFISQRMSLGCSSSAADKLGNGVDARHGRPGPDLSGKSPTGEEGSPGGPQHGSPHSGSTNTSALSDDMTANSTSALSTPGEEHPRRGAPRPHSNATAESRRGATRKRPWSSSECSSEMAFGGRGKRRGAAGHREDGAASPEDHGKDGDGEAVSEDRGRAHSEGSGQSEEEEANKNQNYIFRQPQAEEPAPALGDDLYLCIPCGKGFPNSEELDAHVDAHAKGELHVKAEEDESEVCFQDADRSENLVEREPNRDHDRAPPRHACSVCSRACADLASLKEHEKSHWLTRPFPCNICGKLFTQRGTMTRHMRSHLGLKPFACDECGMRFTRQYRLTEHMRVHSGEKPYGCQVCGGKFTQHRNLISHLKMHTSPS